MNEHMERVRTHIDKMPSLSVTVAKVVEVCNRPGTSPIDLNKVISVDPVLMARVLKLINSAYYGLSGKVTSLARAIIMLGINTVKNLALSTAIVGNLGSGEHFNALHMQGFWRHSLGVGVTAKLIAKKRGVDSKLLEEFFIAGLLHDIGKIPLNNVLSDTYVEILAAADREREPLDVVENRVLGFTHCDVGAMIAKTWNLGGAISDAILFHHRPDEYTGDSSDLVHSTNVANYFLNICEIGFSGDRFPGGATDASLTAIGVTLDSLDAMEDEVRAEISKAEVFLNPT